MINKSPLFFLILFIASSLFAGAGFYQDPGANQYQKVVFEFGNNYDEWKRLDTEVDGQWYGNKSSGDTWILKGGEGFVWKNNGSDITAVTLYYRIYKTGDTPPTFSSINLPWDADLGGNNQRWATNGASVDIIAAATSGGNWKVEFYMTATTNGVDCNSVLYWSNNGNNFTLNFDMGPIDVELTAFTAVVHLDGVLLEWRTASESNHAGFNIHKSADGQIWRKVNAALITGANEINGAERVYRWVDEGELRSGLQYRLETVNLNGASSFSETVRVQRVVTPPTPRLSVFPNPFNPSTTLTLEIPESGLVEVVAYNLQGQKVAEIVRGVFPQGATVLNWSTKVNGAPLPSGVYVVALKSGRSVVTQKVVKLQ